VYYGLGALFSIHVLNLGKVPAPFIRWWAACRLAFGLDLGYITTRRAGTRSR
jgi:hypothetical protein